MINAYIECLSPEDVMLRVEGMEDYMLFFRSEWLPKGPRVGDLVTIKFEIKPKIRNKSNLHYLPMRYEYEPND